MPTTQILTIMGRKALSLVGSLAFLALMLSVTNLTAAAQAEVPEHRAGLASSIKGSWVFTVHLIKGTDQIGAKICSKDRVTVSERGQGHTVRTG